MFQRMFMESDGAPIDYNGKTLMLADKFETHGHHSFRVLMERVSPSPRQGIHFRVDGTFYINRRFVKYDMLLWYDTAPSMIDFEIDPVVPAIDIWNVWDYGDGVVHSWHNGAAMTCEEVENGRRYFCNDGRPDDNFDDLIFTIERIA